MLKIKKRLLGLVMVLFLISACGPEVLVLGGIVGSGAGTYYYINGELVTDYSTSFDKAWNACEKTVADMRGKDVQPKREIGQGTIYTMINDDNVKFSVTYKTKNLTTVGIRVGFFGNKLSEQLLHDKVYENIIKK
jgi:hypothetical protein